MKLVTGRSRNFSEDCNTRLNWKFFRPISKSHFFRTYFFHTCKNADKWIRAKTGLALESAPQSTSLTFLFWDQKNSVFCTEKKFWSEFFLACAGLWLRSWPVARSSWIGKWNFRYPVQIPAQVQFWHGSQICNIKKEDLWENLGVSVHLNKHHLRVSHHLRFPKKESRVISDRWQEKFCCGTRSEKIWCIKR